MSHRSIYKLPCCLYGVSQVAQLVKNLPANEGDARDRFDPQLRKIPQCSCLGNPMDREAWWATVHGVAKSRTRLSMHAYRIYIFVYIGSSGKLAIIYDLASVEKCIVRIE